MELWMEINIDTAEMIKIQLIDMILLQMRAIIKAKGAPTTYFILANKPVHTLIMD